jgi:sugar fermentation stimulation protein A
VEVKACSLVEYGAAMFPDAPSERAYKHLEELAELSRRGYRCHVLFVIVHGRPDVFIPNLHTDPALTAGLSRFKSVEVHAALLRTEKNGQAVLAKTTVPVDLNHGSLAESNGGSYLIILEIQKKIEPEAGSLGRILFKPGWYVYAGSAMKNLAQRISRHQRKIRKQKHWHLDYLVPFAAGPIMALPILSYRNLECALARDLHALGGKPSINGFGSSDCKKHCPAHLFYFADSPLLNYNFISMILRYRHREAFVKP